MTAVIQFSKVIIAGGREFCSAEHYLLLQRTMDDLILDLGLPAEIVSGGARGADTLGERYAIENHIEVARFIPKWDAYGKKAGVLRNADMGRYGDALVAFWDGKSVGTKHMIDFARNNGLTSVVVKY